MLGGWEVRVSEHVGPDMPAVLYLYDFGDDWEHEVTYEGLVARDPLARYPRCVAGAGACPPEDAAASVAEASPHFHAASRLKVRT